ncbi:MAG: HPr kinase/phosphatase C-terminal domain-containing protein [Rhizobiaceae bacterium]
MNGKSSEPLDNLHASLVCLDGEGVLVTGRSGVGKTSLAFGLMDAARLRNLDAALVADDRVIITSDGKRLYGAPPQELAGLAELRGLGIVRVDWQASAPIRLAVHICDDATIERMPHEEVFSLSGISLRSIRVPERHEAQGVRLVLAALGLGEFGRNRETTQEGS